MTQFELVSAHPELEIISPNQSKTQNLHAGEMRIQILEMAYSTEHIAELGGTRLPPTAIIAHRMLCQTGNNGPLRDCFNNETAIAFLRTWYINKGKNATFRYQGQSTYYPYRKHFSELFIN